MTKVIPSSEIYALSGKLSSREKSFFATNKRTGRVYLTVVENPYKGPWSEKQIAHRKAFAHRSKTASQWLKDNDPKHQGGKGTKEYQAMLRKYLLQHKIGNIFAFVAKHYEDGKIRPFLKK